MENLGKLNFSIKNKKILHFDGRLQSKLMNSTDDGNDFLTDAFLFASGEKHPIEI